MVAIHIRRSLHLGNEFLVHWGCRGQLSWSVNELEVRHLGVIASTISSSKHARVSSWSEPSETWDMDEPTKTKRSAEDELVTSSELLGKLDSGFTLGDHALKVCVVDLLDVWECCLFVCEQR